MSENAKYQYIHSQTFNERFCRAKKEISWTVLYATGLFEQEMVAKLV